MMKKTFCLVIALLWISLVFPRILAAQTADLESSINQSVSRAMYEGQIPSLTVTIVSGDEVAWSGAWGMSNLRVPIPAKPDTVYLIGSIFKTMQAVALLQLVEKGKLSLDDPVSSYLDELEIRGEDPQNPVTFRHLLTHSSGIPGQAEKGAFPDAVDEETKRIIPYWDRPFQAYPIWGYSLPPPIKDYLLKGLQVTRPPLDRVEYSPMAFTLVAYIIEKLSGTPFMQYMRENVFDPLEMTSTAFIPTADMDERFAIPYVFDEERGEHVPIARVRVAIWATGQVYGTSGDLGKWLITNLNGGTFKGRRILGSETIPQAHTVQFDRSESDFGIRGWGLGWSVTEKKGVRYISHSGSLPGETAFVLANVNRKVGVAIVSNGNRAHRHLEPLAYEILASLEEQEEEVKAFVQEFAGVWTNAQEPAEIAAYYSVDATHVNPQGQWTRTRENLVPYFAPLVARRSDNFSAEFQIEAVEMLRPGVALVDGVIIIKAMPDAGGREIPRLEERFTFLMKKTDGKWLIHASRVMFPDMPM